MLLPLKNCLLNVPVSLVEFERVILLSSTFAGQEIIYPVGGRWSVPSVGGCGRWVGGYTITRIIQGDCAILFIFYLAKCLKIPIHTKVKGFLINSTYADDITIAGTNTRQIDEINEKMTEKLTKYNLKINQGKTERYQIPRPKPPPPPPTTLKELLQHKVDRIINYSELDWLLLLAIYFRLTTNIQNVAHYKLINKLINI